MLLSMAKSTTSLKTKNAAYIWTFIGLHCAILLAIIILGKIDYDSINDFWHKVKAKDSFIAAAIPIVSILLNGLLGDQMKARLVFWRWKNPLPGCRAFSDLIRKDPRININNLKGRLGSFPRSPKDQNSLWFKLYRKHSESLVVSDSHRIYLLTRDIAGLAAIFAVLFPMCVVLTSATIQVVLIYFIVLLIQYLIAATSARNYGNRFVMNVLTEESHSK